MGQETIRTTAVPGPPRTTTVETPKCTCCTPQQPLEAPLGNDTSYQCPVTGHKYTYDPAEGIARPAANAQRADRRESSSVFPQAPSQEEIRRVDPSEPFA